MNQRIVRDLVLFLAAPGAASVTTPPLFLFGGGFASHVATPAVSPPSTTVIMTLTLSGSQLLGVSGGELATPAVSARTTTDVTTTAPLTTGSQILGVNGLVLPNATTNGAVPQAPTSAAVLGPLTAVVESQGEVIPASGGSSITGVRPVGPCPSAWRLGTKLRRSPRPVGRGYAPARWQSSEVALCSVTVPSRARRSPLKFCRRLNCDIASRVARNSELYNPMESAAFLMLSWPTTRGACCSELSSDPSI